MEPGRAGQQAHEGQVPVALLILLWCGPCVATHKGGAPHPVPCVCAPPPPCAAAGELLSFGRPTYGRLGQQDAEVAADSGGWARELSSHCLLAALDPPTPLPHLAPSTQPACLALPTCSLPRAQAGGWPAGGEGSGRSGRPGSVRCASDPAVLLCFGSGHSCSSRLPPAAVRAQCGC